MVTNHACLVKVYRKSFALPLHDHNKSKFFATNECAIKVETKLWFIYF